jgi:putative ABC transport system permease protein
MFKIAYRNLFRRKGRTALALMGVALGVGTVIALVGIAEAVNSSVTETLGQMQLIQVLEEGALSPVLSSISTEKIDEIRKIQGVKTAYGVIMRPAISIEGGSTDPLMGAGAPIPIMGVDTEEIEQARGGGFSGRVTRGRALTNNDKYAVVLGQNIADDYNKNVGLSIEINNNKFLIVGLFTTGSDFLDNAILMPIDIAREGVGVDDDTVSTITVEPYNLDEIDRVSELIEFRIEDVDAKTGSEFAESISQMTGFLASFLWVISLVSAIIGGVGIINTMLMSVLERTNEFGLLKATGWTNSNLIKLVITESVLVGFVGGLVGLIVGSVGVFVLNELVGVSSVLSLPLIFQAMFMAITFGTLGGIYPAYKATKIDPIEALREG